MVYINSPPDRSFVFPFLFSKSYINEILTRWFDHQNYLESPRALHESCRSRRDLSIPTNLISFRPPYTDNFASQGVRSDKGNLQLVRARSTKSKFLWWVCRSDHPLQLSCWKFFDLTYGFIAHLQIYFESTGAKSSFKTISNRHDFNTEVVPLVKIFPLPRVSPCFVHRARRKSCYKIQIL
jgi:hypothetical protein